MASAPPRIFSERRRKAARLRLRQLQKRQNAARFIIDDMIEDVIDRLSFVRHEPSRALVIGDWRCDLAGQLRDGGAEVTQADLVAQSEAIKIGLERPYPEGAFDFIACLGLLDTVNDLPGALVHIRNALAPGGMAIASFVGAGSLPVLRRIMLAADGERPAGRMHPLVDVRAAAQLLQRVGWAHPVVDSRPIHVGYRSLDRLIGDLRAQGLGNVLASPAPPPGKAGLARARGAFAEEAGPDGRLVETFEILTLSGRRSLAGT